MDGSNEPLPTSTGLASTSSDRLENHQSVDQTSSSGRFSVDIMTSESHDNIHTESMGDHRSITSYSDTIYNEETAKKNETDELLCKVNDMDVTGSPGCEPDTKDTQDSKVQDADRLLQLAAIDWDPDSSRKGSEGPVINEIEAVKESQIVENESLIEAIDSVLEDISSSEPTEKHEETTRAPTDVELLQSTSLQSQHLEQTTSHLNDSLEAFPAGSRKTLANDNVEEILIKEIISTEEIPADMSGRTKRKRGFTKEDGDKMEEKDSDTNLHTSGALVPTSATKLNAKKARASLDSIGTTEDTIHVHVPTSTRKPKEMSASSAKKRRLSISSALDLPTSSASSRETRSTASLADTALSPSMDGNLRVFYASSTTVDNLANVMKTLAKHGVHKAANVKACDYLCVGHGKELKKTAHLILAVAMGKYVITDNWAKESAAQAHLLDPLGYLAEDPVREAEWGTTLREASERGRQELKPLLDKKILVTPFVSKGSSKTFADIKEIAKLAGASFVLSRLPRPDEHNSKTLIISSQADPLIHDLRNNGWRCFTTEIITISILRGKLDTDSDEFVVSDSTSDRGSRRKRK